MQYLVIVSLLLCVGCAVASSSDNVLILLDNWAIRETHSKYFKNLRNAGFDLTFKLADDKSIQLSKYSEKLYDNLILFCPSVQEFGGDLSVQEVVNFIDDGGNVIIAADSNIGEPIREIAAECGVEYDEKDTYVIDHMNFDVKDNGQHTLVVGDAANLAKSDVLVGGNRKDVLFEGVGMASDPENPLVTSVLHAASTAYSYKPDEGIVDYPHAVGKATLMIAALQARNNARVLFSGSLSFFSDEFFDRQVEKVKFNGNSQPKDSGNEALAITLSGWTFGSQGILRIGEVQHHKIGEKKSPEYYTIMDDLEFSIVIEELVNGKWVPFTKKDVQLEFVRIDPFVRQTMIQKGNKYYANFKVPDVYGVYQFKVNYKRVGYTYLSSNTQISVRPLEHTQYERFIPCAYPYYVSAFSMMAGVVIFSVVFAHHRDTPSKTKSE